MTHRDEWTVRLKDGSEVDGRIAEATLNLLKQELASNPDRIRQLVEISGCDVVEQSEFGKILEGSYFANGELRPIVRALLLNAATTTSSHITFNDPYGDDQKTRSVLAMIAANQRIFEERLHGELDALEDL